MTKEHFFKLLKNTGKYEVDKLGHIRRCEDGLCPILAVYKDVYSRGEEPMRYGNEDAYCVGKGIGLPENIVEFVIDGADNFKCATDVAMRTELLTAVGLTQEVRA